MDICTSAWIARVCELNDNFRSSFRGGQVLLTDSVAALPDMVKASALEKVATFNQFTNANDPLGIHDYGWFEHCNRVVLWRLHTYNLALDGFSPDPSDPTATRRILFIGLAQDW